MSKRVGVRNWVGYQPESDESRESAAERIRELESRVRELEARRDLAALSATELEELATTVAVTIVKAAHDREAEAKALSDRLFAEADAAAAQTRASADKDAAKLLAAADADAASRRQAVEAEAKRVKQEADKTAKQTLNQANAEATALVESARIEAERLRTVADSLVSKAEASLANSISRMSAAADAVASLQELLNTSTSTLRELRAETKAN